MQAIYAQAHKAAILILPGKDANKSHNKNHHLFFLTHFHSRQGGKGEKSGLLIRYYKNNLQVLFTQE